VMLENIGPLGQADGQVHADLRIGVVIQGVIRSSMLSMYRAMRWPSRLLAPPKVVFGGMEGSTIGVPTGRA